MSDQEENTRLKGVIERDRSRVADTMARMRKALLAREWLRLGRGSYEWDDDRWRDEFAQAWNELWNATESLKTIAADLSDSPATHAEAVAARR